MLGANALANAPSAAAADCPVSGMAVTNWINTSGGDWNTATNWSNGVPTAACDANIMGTGPYTVTLTTTAATKKLTIGQTGLKTINVSSNGTAAGITASGELHMGTFGEIVLDCPIPGCTGAAPFIDVGASPNRLWNQGGKITVTPQAGDGSAILKGDVLNQGGTLQFNGSAQYRHSTGATTTLDNQGTINLANGVTLTSADDTCPAGGGTVAVTNGTSGHINATGTGTLSAQVFNQGAGDTSGIAPVTLPCGGLNYTGAGASGVLVNGNVGLTGNLAAGQNLKVVSGTLTAAGGSTNAGAITLDSTSANVALDAPAATLTNSGTITTTGTANTRTIKGNLSNSGTLQVNSDTMYTDSTGPATLTQTAGTTAVGTGAALDLTGATGSTFSLNGGTLSGGGSVTGSVNNASGTVAPGSSPGTLTISGNYTQGPAGTLDVEVDGTTPGQFDKLVVGANATLGGTLALHPSSAFAAAAVPGDSVGFLAGTNAGTFATTTVTPPLAGGNTFNPGYGPTAVNAVVGAPPPPPLPLAPTLTVIPTPTAIPDTTRPGLSALGFSSRSFLARAGTTLKLTLSEAATISAVVNQSVRGHRVRGRCSPSAKTATRCTLTVRRAKTTFRGAKGANRLRFKVSSLKPGSYALVLTARDAAGNVSRTFTLRFTIKQAPRRR